MRRFDLPVNDLQEALDASPSALQKGVQQFLTPQPLAHTLLSPYRIPVSTIETAVADLFGAGKGALLAPIQHHLSVRTFAIELDSDCKPEGIHHHLRADTATAVPLLIETNAKFDLLVANPPFSLTWPCDDQPLNSTLATFRWMLQLLNPRGQGMLLCNAASIVKLQQHFPHDLAAHVHTLALLPNYFPHTGRWQEMTLAALYFSPSHSPTSSPHTIDLTALPADDTTLTTLRQRLTRFPHQFDIRHSEDPATDPLPRFRAVATELDDRRQQRRAGHAAYNILLRPNGTLSTYLTPFERYAKAPKLPRALIEDLASLNNRHLRDLVVARSQRSALEAAVHGTVWRVDPQLPTALAKATAEYNALRTPISILNDVQRLGFIDEENTLLCTKAIHGCQPGQRYPITTQVTEGRTIQHRPRYDRPPLYPNGPHPKEEIHTRGMELEITVKTPNGPLHFTHHPNLSQRTLKPTPLQTLISHFQIPHVPALEEAYATEFQAAIDHIYTLCPRTSPLPPPTTTPAKPTAHTNARRLDPHPPA
jgi:hypothetical protein